MVLLLAVHVHVEPYTAVRTSANSRYGRTVLYTVVLKCMTRARGPTIITDIRRRQSLPTFIGYNRCTHIRRNPVYRANPNSTQAGMPTKFSIPTELEVCS